MNGTDARVRALVSTTVVLVVAWTLILSVSPQLHARVHCDASAPEHTCAATFVASGNYEHLTQPPPVHAYRPVAKFTVIPALASHWVDSPFLLGHIFAHAPPANP